MAIDRSNYQIWFLDYVDGSLNEKERLEVENFLAGNPHLRNEFESLGLPRLKQGSELFTAKERAIRSVSDYSSSQFEHLCIAALENDLTPGEFGELQEIINADALKRRIFELYSRMKLIPLPGTFAGKQRLSRLTTGQKIFRIALAGSAIAASIAVFTIAYMLLTGNQSKNPVVASGNLLQDTLTIDRGRVILSARGALPYENDVRGHGKNETGRKSEINHKVLMAEEKDIPVPLPDRDPRELAEPPSPLKVTIPQGIVTGYVPSSAELIARKTQSLPSFFDDGRSNVDRFLARFFHEKIMNDKKSGDKPVESIEIAEAGIAGINKLLGWDMELQKKTDQNGITTSYYFSSRLLKFTTPVRKQGKEL